MLPVTDNGKSCDFYIWKQLVSFLFISLVLVSDSTWLSFGRVDSLQFVQTEECTFQKWDLEELKGSEKAVSLWAWSSRTVEAKKGYKEQAGTKRWWQFRGHYKQLYSSMGWLFSKGKTEKGPEKKQRELRNLIKRTQGELHDCSRGGAQSKTQTEGARGN